MFEIITLVGGIFLTGSYLWLIVVGTIDYWTVRRHNAQI